MAQVETILATLGRSLSQPTFGDLLERVTAPWAKLRSLLQAGTRLDRLPDVDALAEEMLDHSERLTANLEIAAFANALRAINVAGRQRMLSQRLAKEALLASLLPRYRPALDAAQTEAALEGGLTFLRSLPLSNAEIGRELAETGQAWAAFKTALGARDAQPGRERIAVLSEQLLGHFDRLTNMLERAMQAFTG